MTSVIEYLEKHLGKFTKDQVNDIEELGIKTIEDLLFLEEDMLNYQNPDDDCFSPIQKRKLITIANYMKLSLDENVSLNAMYQCVNNIKRKKTPQKASSTSTTLNKPKAEVELDDNDLFSRHLIVTKYKSNESMEGKGYVLLFPPEWHKTAEDTLKMWPSSWEVWQFCKLNNV